MKSPNCSENWAGITQECARQELLLVIQWSASSTHKLAPVNILYVRQAGATMFNALQSQSFATITTSSTTDSLERQTLRHAVLRATDPKTRRRRASREKPHPPIRLSYSNSAGVDVVFPLQVFSAWSISVGSILQRAMSSGRRCVWQ